MRQAPYLTLELFLRLSASAKPKQRLPNWKPWALAEMTSAAADLGASFAVFLILCVLVGMGTGCAGELTTRLPWLQPGPAQAFSTTTFQEGSLLVMQNQTATETVRIALETNWGGSVVEVSLNGTNYVNRHDTGREVQPAFYDGNAPSAMLWDPVLGGDWHDHGTPTLVQTLTSDFLYTKAQPLQWNPEAWGGGPTQSVPGDVLVEQTVTSVTSSDRAFHLHYKVTHLGSDLHANAVQEFPAVYVTNDLNQLVYYGGSAPWTNGTVSIAPLTAQTSPLMYAPEHWGALINAQNMGLTVYVPSQYPWVHGICFPGIGGPIGEGTSYLAPFTTLMFAPNSVFEGDIYVIAGDYRTARQVVYDLHRTLPSSHIFTPFGAHDLPAQNSLVSGITPVAGWAFDEGSVATVDVLVDGVVDGVASYGSSRPDVAGVFPNAPVNIGFSYLLETAKYSNGAHKLNIRVTDSSGNIAIFPDRTIIVFN